MQERRHPLVGAGRRVSYNSYLTLVNLNQNYHQ
jgi:hypothetical protein